MYQSQWYGKGQDLADTLFSTTLRRIDHSMPRFESVIDQRMNSPRPRSEHSRLSSSAEKAERVSSGCEIAGCCGAGQSRRLLWICAGVRTDFQDFRQICQKQQNRVKRRLITVERLQRRSETEHAWATTETQQHTKRVLRTLFRLFCAFRSFSVEALESLRSILQTNLEIYALLKQVNTSIPRAMFKDRDECLQFADALGRIQFLEYRWFQHWEIFIAMLKCLFKDRPGEQNVLRGHFMILDTRNQGRVINPDIWSRAISPTSRIKMSMLIAGNAPEDSHCPFCLSQTALKCCSIPTLSRW